MKLGTAIVGLFLLSVSILSLASDVKVKGYYRKDGTYVQPHYRSAPNHTKMDNWTTKGNVNPYTGVEGTRTYQNYDNYSQSYQSEPHHPNANYSTKYLYENVNCGDLDDSLSILDCQAEQEHGLITIRKSSINHYRSSRNTEDSSVKNIVLLVWLFGAALGVVYYIGKGLLYLVSPSRWR